MVSICRIDFTSKSNQKNTQVDFNVNEIYIDKSTIGKNEHEKLNFNFLAVARNNLFAKELVSKLANNGFFLIEHKNGISVYRKLNNYYSFINSFNNTNVKLFNDIYYTLDQPKEMSIQPKLLVVFSSIADSMYNASISRRMFFKNYREVQKFIPKDTYVLRIADIGGVLGSFYLNSNFDGNFENKVQTLINHALFTLGVDKSHVVLYGSSKGATGALYHGIHMGLKTLSVDPIVSDEFYLERQNDSHFVENNFPCFKEEKFSKLINNCRDKDLSNINLVTSQNSEQFNYIKEIVLTKNESINSFVFNNPNIKGHTDMGPHTLNFVTSMLNNLLYDMLIAKGFTAIF